ncbi:hypothetical protein AOCH_004262 [Aspergillus ochraceoroseus]|uniref:Pre-mRNA-splicing factor cwc26 n=1 Tax=Aspergillus ochraceoroseus TaxID=138278 RepID=A0A0F8WA09_9EURO|nr:hypothetical protein AOCH_004262 [Aspergillus ochraceoroseus]
MPSSSLAEYLAKNYLTADPSSAPERPPKKRKKSGKPQQPDGLIIADDDPPDLRAMGGASSLDADEYSPSIVNSGRSAEFRRTKKSNWKVVGTADEQDAADKILADAAAEDAPAVVGGGEEDDDDEGMMVRMESGARAGLQTAAQTAAMVAAQERRRKADEARYKSGDGTGTGTGRGGEGQETIYRDASGRIINRREREERRQQLAEAKVMPLARTAEDEALNEELKAQQRWNDPAAQFLTKSTGPGTSTTGKPLYKGGFQPNRYGIRPGHRWDGVDRGTGFEKEWFAARSKKGRLEALEYEWQMDV